MNYQKTIEKLLLSGINIFSTLEFARLFGASKIAAQKFLTKYAKKGTFTKIKNGLYYFNLNLPPETIIANKLYEPSYISFEYALNFYGIIPESVYGVTSATTKATREFNVAGRLFSYYRLKKTAFFGYKPQEIDGNKIIYIAEPEKALADYLYFVDLKKKKMSERIDIKKIKQKKLFLYLKKFKRSSLLKLAKKLYD